MDNKDSYHIIQARHKQTDLEELVSKYEFFILRCASDSTGKYISKMMNGLLPLKDLSVPSTITIRLSENLCHLQS